MIKKEKNKVQKICIAKDFKENHFSTWHSPKAIQNSLLYFQSTIEWRN